MAGDSGAVCSACSTPLGDPSDEIAQSVDQEPPEGAHFALQERSDGELRAQCRETGQLASVVAGTKKINPITGEVTGTVEGEGEGKQEEPTPERETQEKPEPTPEPSSSSKVYDLPDDKDQEDVLMEVVSNDHYGLNREQIQELHSWSQDFDGQMPPDMVQEVIGLMNGINKQTAQLIRERYELKLNKWIREQSQDNNSPRIGAASRRGVQQRGSSPNPPRPAPNPEPNGTTGPDDDDEEEARQQEDRSRMGTRQARRQRAVDKAAEEFADQFAKNLAADAGSFFSDARDIARTLLKKKAESDPEWFFEKMEQYDMELVDTVLEPSEAKKEEITGGGGAAVDSEIDNALENIGGSDTSPAPDPEPTPTEDIMNNNQNNPMKSSPQETHNSETPNNPPDVQEDTDMVAEDEGGEADDQFDEIFNS